METNTCICTSLRQAAQSGTAFYDARLATSGLKVTMFRLLRRITQSDDTSITGLAQIVGLDRSTLGRNLRVLEKQGLVRLSTGQDERERTVEITRNGEEALARALPLWQAAQADLKEAIGTDLETLLETLNRVVALSNLTEGNA